MKKSVSIPDDLAIQVQNMVYVRRRENPRAATSFSEVVNQALELFLNRKREGVT